MTPRLRMRHLRMHLQALSSTIVHMQDKVPTAVTATQLIQPENMEALRELLQRGRARLDHIEELLREPK